MKQSIINVIGLVCTLISPQILPAQGTLYLSNMGQTAAGNYAVAANSWVAAGFATGSNPGGYVLNSIQLAMADAVGSPTGFSVMLYSDGRGSAAAPGAWLAMLNGSTDPSTAGIYTYTPASSFILSPDAIYYLVLTAGTRVSSGAYEWSYTGVNSYNSTGGWNSESAHNSPSGLGWPLIHNPYFQFAITATPVPEPTTAWLLLAGGGILFYVRKRRSI